MIKINQKINLVGRNKKYLLYVIFESLLRTLQNRFKN